MFTFEGGGDQKSFSRKIPTFPPPLHLNLCPRVHLQLHNLSFKPSPTHTLSGTPPSLASSLLSQGQGTNPAPISADYITGINKINLGNDLSKMYTDFN